MAFVKASAAAPSSESSSAAAASEIAAASTSEVAVAAAAATEAATSIKSSATSASKRHARSYLVRKTVRAVQSLGPLGLNQKPKTRITVTATLPPQPRPEGQRLARKMSVTCLQPCERRPTTHEPPPPAGRKGLSRIPSLPPLHSTSNFLRPPGLLPLLTGATCTSGPGAHTHTPVLPPHTSLFGHRTGTKLKWGGNHLETRIPGLEKARHLRKQVRYSLSERAFSAGRVSVISQHQPLLYDSQLYLPMASRTRSIFFPFFNHMK